MNWLKLGDKNTGYFHRILRIRNNNNRINKLIAADGRELTEESEIGGEACRYFENLFDRSHGFVYPGKSLLRNYMTQQLKRSEAEALCIAVTTNEVKNVLFSFKPDKSPGPDGFNNFFFMKYWYVVGKDVVDAVIEFFENGSMLKQINNTIIALIPKIKNPTCLKDFRPISCCSTVYKIISKILANRLKKLLPDYIHEAQGAFIPGRSISDNIFLAQELLQGYHLEKGAPRVTVKVDILKAYDTLRWDFLWDVFEIMGFPRKFVSWIKACITTPSFSVSINGGLHGFFHSSRGLRQGDPMSPYLFVLCMNVLSNIMMNKTKDKAFQYHWRCSRTKITHLSFADDLLLFAHGDRKSCKVIHEVLLLFSRLSRLEPSVDKSTVCISGVTRREADFLASIFGFSRGVLPFRYLGVPLITTALRRTECLPLLEYVKNKIEHWVNKLLSFAGRLQLINAVLASSLVFWCSHFVLPCSIYKDLERYIRNFLWSGSYNNHSKAKVAWEDVCKPKKEGGLGIRKLQEMNLALMAKWAWKFCDESRNSIWRRWVFRYLIRKQTFWNLKIPVRCSWFWRKLLQSRPKLEIFIRKKIVSGTSTLFWWDNWLEGGPLEKGLTREDIESSGIGSEMSVAAAYSFMQGQCPLSPLFGRLQGRAVPVFTNGNDKYIWLDQKEHFFSTKRAWESVRSKGIKVSWYYVIWRAPTIPRCSFTSWVIAKGKLPTSIGIRSKGYSTVSRCILCLNGEEDLDHLYFNCNVSGLIWRTIIGHEFGWMNFSSYMEWQEWAIKFWSKKESSRIRLLFNVTTDAIWKERNERMYEGKHTDPRVLAQKIVCVVEAILVFG